MGLHLCPCIFELLGYTKIFMDMKAAVFSTSLVKHLFTFHLGLQGKSSH